MPHGQGRYRELARSRTDLVESLDARIRLMAVGTHPTSISPIAMTARPRYLELVADNSWLVRCGIPSVLHIHVAVPDPDEALAVYNSARSYLPELAALAANSPNSPFFEERDTGLASSRLKLCEDPPRAGVPPAFASWQELAAFGRVGLAPGRRLSRRAGFGFRAAHLSRTGDAARLRRTRCGLVPQR